MVLKKTLREILLKDEDVLMMIPFKKNLDKLVGKMSEDLKVTGGENTRNI